MTQVAKQAVHNKTPHAYLTLLLGKLWQRRCHVLPLYMHKTVSECSVHVVKYQRLSYTINNYSLYSLKTCT